MHILLKTAEQVDGFYSSAVKWGRSTMAIAFTIKSKSHGLSINFPISPPLLPLHVCISLLMDDMVTSESFAPIFPRPPLLTFVDAKLKPHCSFIQSQLFCSRFPYEFVLFCRVRMTLLKGPLCFLTAHIYCCCCCYCCF